MSPLSDSPIVVGVDGSAPAAAALAWAARRAKITGARVHILHAFAVDLPMLGFGEVEDRDSIRQYAASLVTAATARVHSLAPGARVTTSVARGFASPALIAASHDAQAVVVGTTGQGTLSKISLGPVAMQVATHAACPIVLVADEMSAPTDPPRVVVGVDGSEASLRALDKAVEQAGVLGATLEVVHAWQARSVNDPNLSAGSNWAEYEGRVTSLVTDRVARAPRPAALANTDRPVPAVELVRGDPVKVLAERSKGAAEIIVGCRGAGGFPGLHLGTVALGLLGRARCPLMLIH